MARAEILWVYAYDVEDDRRRRRIAAILDDEAVRVQYSVFEIHATEREAEALLRRLSEHLGPDDSIRMYAIDPRAAPRCRMVGNTPPIEDAEYWVL